MLKSVVIEEKKFKHSPWAWGDNPLGPKFWCQQEGLITMVICCKFEKKISSTSDFIHIFSWFNKCIKLQFRGRQPQGQNFDVNRNLLSLRSFATSLKKSLWHLILLQFFHDLVHVYSPGTGDDIPLGTNFWCQQEYLVTSVTCCKFKKILFEVWFYTICFMILYMYIAPGLGQTAPRG